MYGHTQGLATLFLGLQTQLSPFLLPMFLCFGVLTEEGVQGQSQGQGLGCLLSPGQTPTRLPQLGRGARLKLSLLFPSIPFPTSDSTKPQPLTPGARRRGTNIC